MTDNRKDGTGQREVGIAAVGDLHFDGTAPGSQRDLFAEINRNADILVLCGDLTTQGRPDQIRGFIGELAGVDIPIVAVLGNHDFDANLENELSAILEGRGIHVLDGSYSVVDGIGFAGTKGFAGGFGRTMLAPFGEPLIKEFVQASINEAIKLENALRSVDTPTKVAVMHYSPVLDTCIGEFESIYPFLGSSRMQHPLDAIGADVVFHGHAHHGALTGATPGGTPVYNVSLPLLREHGHQFLLWSTHAPERRGDAARPQVRRPHARIVAQKAEAPAERGNMDESSRTATSTASENDDVTRSPPETA